MQSIGKTIHNYLTQVNVDGSLGPEIAESWEGSEGATKWVFKLRKDVTFHNGQKMTVKDVIASLNHHGGEDTKSAAKVIVDAISEMKAEDDYTLALTLTDGNADLPYQLSDYHLAILPANAEGKVDPTSGIGCGYYKVKSYDPGVKTELEKFADHWNADAVHLDSAEFLTIADVTARINALTTGEIDVADRMNLNQDISRANLWHRDIFDFQNFFKLTNDGCFHSGISLLIELTINVDQRSWYRKSIK